MAFKSKAQGKYFQYLESKGKLPKRATVDDSDDSSEYAHMADGGMVYDMQDEDQRVSKDKQRAPYPSRDPISPYRGASFDMQEGQKRLVPNRSPIARLEEGGIVGTNYDYDMGNASEYDSSGEPDTEFEQEDEQPMEYMSRGGKVKKMSKGGMLNRSNFVKAIKRGY